MELGWAWSRECTVLPSAEPGARPVGSSWGKRDGRDGSCAVARATAPISIWLPGELVGPQQAAPHTWCPARPHNMHVCAFLSPAVPAFSCFPASPHCAGQPLSCLLLQSTSAIFPKTRLTPLLCLLSPTALWRSQAPPLRSAPDTPSHLVTSPALPTP